MNIQIYNSLSFSRKVSPAEKSPGKEQLMYGKLIYIH